MKTAISILIVGVIIAGFFIFSGRQNSGTPVVNAQNVTMENGIQIVEVNVKGGYSPSQSMAKAGIPTVLRFKTDGTFDCSSAIRIPSMNISKNLPQTGSTDIDVGNPQLGTLQGVCGMGMYRFSVNFQS